ncbi:MAG: A/G-specific adenine glycosylase [Oscillochloris sp.]|nr:A/G-specific adenine glycosylase [Oscillochloris sp.]
MMTLSSLQSALLAWFAANGRDLPWRHTRDPYRILVSEIMLQQTQVDRVIPKYLAFLETFPDVQALAEAPTAEVIRLWAGLGYNRRAINLQRAAQTVWAQYGGQFPRSVAELRALPGVGPYTAGAVACFAFEQDVAFMDTNIRRVLGRLLIGEDDAPRPPDQVLLELGAQLIPAGAGWAWNQAIMELGALICTAAAPACRRCPLRSECRSFADRQAADEALVLTMGEVSGAPTRKLRRVAERKSEPYVGSRRWYRGRIVAALREVPAGATISLADLGPQVKPDYAADDSEWLSELVSGLARDGLVVWEADAVRLP